MYVYAAQCRIIDIKGAEMPNTECEIAEQRARLLKQKEKFEMLGVYYDSKAHLITATPEKFNCDLRFTYNGVDNYGNLVYKANIITESKTTAMTQGSNILEHINNYVPYYYVKQGYNTSKEGYKVQVNDFSFNMSYNTSGIKCFNILEDILSANPAYNTHLPKVINLSLDIKRDTDSEYRAEICKSEVDNKDIKQYFADVCNPSLIVPDANRNRWYNQYTGFSNGCVKFAGTIKDRIFYGSGFLKQDRIFALEYLYGIKIPKTATLKQVYDKMRNLPYNDFGIKDIRIMQKLVEDMRYPASTAQLWQKLHILGVKPVTDLGRWKKVRQLRINEGLQVPEIIKK
jgi:hypothetical protein